jgi:hypothetical protein
MTALIKIQDNQTEIMNAIQGIQFNQLLAIELQGSVAQQQVGLGTTTANSIQLLVDAILGQTASN